MVLFPPRSHSLQTMDPAAMQTLLTEYNMKDHTNYIALHMDDIIQNELQQVEEKLTCVDGMNIGKVQVIDMRLANIKYYLITSVDNIYKYANNIGGVTLEKGQKYQKTISKYNSLLKKCINVERTLTLEQKKSEKEKTFDKMEPIFQAIQNISQVRALTDSEKCIMDLLGMEVKTPYHSVTEKFKNELSAVLLKKKVAEKTDLQTTKKCLVMNKVPAGFYKKLENTIAKNYETKTKSPEIDRLSVEFREELSTLYKNIPKDTFTRSMVQSPVEITESDDKDSLLNTEKNALRFASIYGNLPSVKALVGFGANIHANDDDALRIASNNGHIEIVKYLVSVGADIHADSDHALRIASKSGHFEIVKYLVGAGADIHAESDWALRIASKSGHFEIVKYLVGAGADIHAYSDYALWIASKSGHFEIVKYLVGAGADIHAESDWALLTASKNGHFEIVKYLVGAGADIHADSDLALLTASKNGHLDIVKYLVGAGGDIHAKSKMALRFASENGHLETVKYLKSVGAERGNESQSDQPDSNTPPIEPIAQIKVNVPVVTEKPMRLSDDMCLFLGIERNTEMTVTKVIAIAEVIKYIEERNKQLHDLIPGSDCLTLKNLQKRLSHRCFETLAIVEEETENSYSEKQQVAEVVSEIVQEVVGELVTEYSLIEPMSKNDSIDAIDSHLAQKTCQFGDPIQTLPNKDAEVVGELVTEHVPTLNGLVCLGYLQKDFPALETVECDSDDDNSWERVD